MYTSHFGLAAKPFSIVPNPDILYRSEDHQNVLTMLEYGLSENTGFILLTGEIGTGKTTLIRYMLNEMVAEMDVAVIFNTNFDSDQLYRMILSEFDMPCEVMEKELQLEALYAFLIERYAQGYHMLLVIDEAQHLSDETLEDVRMLTNLQTDDQHLLQILLVGQPELRQRLDRPEFKQLAQRISVNYHLPPFGVSQTARYIAHRIEAVGGSRDLISPEAVQLIHAHANGIPRTINLLCDAVLVYGYADGLARIDGASVEKVVADRICLSVSPAQKKAPAAKATGAGGDIDDMRKRLADVEASLADLTIRYDALRNEIECKMFVHYQEMLASERERFRRMMVSDPSGETAGEREATMHKAQDRSEERAEHQRETRGPQDSPRPPLFAWLFSPFARSKAKK